MAKTPTPTRQASRSLIWLAVLVAVLAAALGGGVLWGGASWTPKLGLDLQGGTEVILTPQLQTGQQITSDELAQAVTIIRNRVDASGVSEAQVSTQGARNIVIDIPGPLDDATKQRIQASSKLEVRPVLLETAAASEYVGADGKATPCPTPAGQPYAACPTPTSPLNSTPSTSPTNNSDLSYLTAALGNAYRNFDCNSLAAGTTNVAPADKPLITCDDTLTQKYLLGPVEVDGTAITDASAQLGTSSQGVSTGAWVVSVTLNDAGATKFNAMSTRLYGYYAANSTDPRAQFAFVLDGKVLEAPQMIGQITGNTSQITGNFTQSSAQALANQLKFGALPVSFKVQTSATISATLGSQQLLSGLIAGAIGLLLVFIYTLIQYRVLGFVTIASLIISAALTWEAISLLSWQIDYRLSLAGVTGLIVAIGFTADSFIVYFERVRDELRDGRPLSSAVEAGWKRAQRTIYAAKTTNLLAAIVLYFLAAGNVQGFAFTLGLTTIIDIIVVILFTHPTLQLAARTSFFADGHPLSGLDPEGLGALYRGAGQFRQAPTVPAAKTASSAREAARRQTIAERKAAQAHPTDPKNDGGDD